MQYPCESLMFSSVLRSVRGGELVLYVSALDPETGFRSVIPNTLGLVDAIPSMPGYCSSGGELRGFLAKGYKEMP